MQKPIRAAVLTAFLGVWVIAPAAGRAASCEYYAGKPCSSGYMTCTWSDGLQDTLVCHNRSWHFA